MRLNEFIDNFQTPCIADEYLKKVCRTLRSAIILNLKALEDLYKLRERNPFCNEESTMCLIESAFRKCVELSCELKKLYEETLESYPTYRPLDLIINSASKASTVSDSLRLISSLRPLRDYQCEVISIYEALLIDLQLVQNNLVIAAKLTLLI